MQDTAWEQQAWVPEQKRPAQWAALLPQHARRHAHSRWLARPRGLRHARRQSRSGGARQGGSPALPCRRRPCRTGRARGLGGQTPPGSTPGRRPAVQRRYTRRGGTLGSLMPEAQQNLGLGLRQPRGCMPGLRPQGCQRPACEAWLLLGAWLGEQARRASVPGGGRTRQRAGGPGLQQGGQQAYQAWHNAVQVPGLPAGTACHARRAPPHPPPKHHSPPCPPHMRPAMRHAPPALLACRCGRLRLVAPSKASTGSSARKGAPMSTP